MGFEITTHDRFGRLDGHTTRMTTSDAAIVVRDEMVRTQSKPGTTITIAITD